MMTKNIAARRGATPVATMSRHHLARSVANACATVGIMGSLLLCPVCWADPVVMTPDAGSHLPNQQQRLGVGEVSGTLRDFQRLPADGIIKNAASVPLAGSQTQKRSAASKADVTDKPKKHHKKHHDKDA